MKAIIVSIATAIMAVVGLAAPAGAIGISGASSTAIASSGWVKMGIGPNGPYLQGESTVCYSSAGVFNINIDQATPVDQSAVQQTPNQNCTAQATTPDPVQNPDTTTTVTINGVCGDPAELAKIEAEHANLIINSVGPCPTNNGTDTPVPTTPVTVVVTPNAPQSNGNVQTASATTSSTPMGTASELPHTGVDGAVASVIAMGLAVISYAGTMAFRAFRARA